ncbi:MAG: class I SAM-dependent methyltransferase [Myxococcales bacterium]|nr:class I SAM-dependent methyltransferase [Myxococcales bacterium]
MESPALSSLDRSPVKDVLDRLHRQARGDIKHFVRLAPRFVLGRLRGQAFGEIVSPAAMRECFIPIDRDGGRLLYLTARAIGARHVVEFGTSFGISTIYLAAATRDNGGGVVVGTEIEPSKAARARAHVEEAGLGDQLDLRVGDALETLQELDKPVDLLFIDGWKDLYRPVLDLVQPRLRPGAVVIADNIFTFRRELRPYVEHLQSGAGGFDSTTIAIGQGLEYSVFRG